MDGRLRALERAARADPTDSAAAWALVRALDQAGDALGAWRERCRLARGGDEHAWRELEASPAAVREVGEIARRELRADPHWLSVSGRTLVIARPRELLVCDTDDLTTRWSGTGGACALAHGPLVIHGDEEERAVLVRDARDGRLCGAQRRAVPTGLAATADRLLVRSRELVRSEGEERDFTRVVDLSDRPGAVIAKHLEPPRTEAVVRGVRFVELEDEDDVTVLEGRDLLTDQVVCRVAGAHHDDGHGDLLVCRIHRDPEYRVDLRIVDASSGRDRWSASHRGLASVGLTSTVVIALETGPGVPIPFAVRAWDRLSGALRWSRSDPARTIARVAHAPASDVLYVASTPWDRSGAPAATVLAIDAATGDVLWTREVPLASSPTKLRLFACPGAALLVAFGSGMTELVRLGPSGRTSALDEPRPEM